jgi:tRNA dimethylallyltransferase
MMKKPLIVLTGPTAVGKTKLSIALAKAVGGEIISADSMQVYRSMDIGSAKIRPEEMDGVPHYLVDVLDPAEEFHIVKFQEMAKEAMKKIYENGHIPILVGGTGFYIQAIVNDIDFTENEENKLVRAKWEQYAVEHGAESLHEKLREIDPKSAEAIPAGNVKRVVRALEFYELSGKRISEHNEEQKAKESPYNYAYFVLNDHRELLYDRIEKRIDEMIEEGLVEEVQGLKDRGFHKDMVSMKGLGYKEILDYLEGNLTLEEAVYILKRDTRHFAKRQLTWFRREPSVSWIHKYEYDYDDEKILDTMLSILKDKGILGE